MVAAIQYLEYRRNGLKNEIKRPNIYPEIRAADKKALKEINEALKLLKSTLKVQ